jgi:hypothetical protein
MTKFPGSGLTIFLSFIILACFVIRHLSFVIALACLSWAKTSETKNCKVNESDNTETEEERVGLKIADLD